MVSLEDMLDPSEGSNTHKIIIMGKPGAGKSTAAACFPNTFVLASGARIQGIKYKKVTPTVKSFSEALEWLKVAYKAKEDFNTIVVDDIDSIIASELQTLREQTPSKKEQDELFGWGGGRAADVVIAALRPFLNALDALRDKHGFHVVVLARSAYKKVNPPERAEYSTNGLEIHDKLAHVLRFWVDTLVFAHQEALTEETGSGKKARQVGVAMSERRFECEQLPQWDHVKNSHHLPSTLPLNGAILLKELDKGKDKKIAFATELEKEIEENEN